MKMTKVVIDVPESIAQYMLVNEKDEVNIRNAMLLYPYIRNGELSFGKAAELLGMYKLDLIVLYGSLGIDYIDMTDAEFEEEMRTVDKLVDLRMR